jgi:hypothetical protein
MAREIDVQDVGPVTAGNGLSGGAKDRLAQLPFLDIVV